MNPWKEQPGRRIEDREKYPLLDAAIERATVVTKYFNAINPLITGVNPPLLLISRTDGLTQDKEHSPEQINFDPVNGILYGDANLEELCNSAELRRKISLNIATGFVKSFITHPDGKNTIFGFCRLPWQRAKSVFPNRIQESFQAPTLPNFCEVYGVDPNDLLLTENSARIITGYFMDDILPDSTPESPFFYINRGRGELISIPKNRSDLYKITKALSAQDKLKLKYTMGHEAFLAIASQPISIHNNI